MLGFVCLRVYVQTSAYALSESCVLSIHFTPQSDKLDILIGLPRFRIRRNNLSLFTYCDHYFSWIDAFWTAFFDVRLLHLDGFCRFLVSVFVSWHL